MTGHIRKRSAKSWELKFDLGADPVTGDRRIRYLSFKGSRREAELELARLIVGASKGEHVDPSKITLGAFFDRWERDWAAANVGLRTLERYRELARVHVRPHLGDARLQKLKPANFAELYAMLLREGRGARGGLAPKTVGHVHRLLHRAIGHAVEWGLLASNPVTARPPRVQAAEIQILTEDQVRSVLQKLRGRSIYLLAAVGLTTGMRRGELLALRWKDVDLDGTKLRVEQSLEQTGQDYRFKSPKTKHGRRTISIPAMIVAELRAHRTAQSEQRLKLGLGKAPDDALVFAKWDGSPMLPESLTEKWRRTVKALKLPKVTMHAWRHTHASQLIASGLDVLTISRRLGHGSPTITLNVYGHLFANTDDRAAQVMEAAFARALRTE